MANDILAGLDFRVMCSDPSCMDRVAKYKIAAEWTGGGFTELKTFGFADDSCLKLVFEAAQERAASIRLGEEERLGELQIYLLDSSRHDYELLRATQEESELSSRIQAPLKKESPK